MGGRIGIDGYLYSEWYEQIHRYTSGWERNEEDVVGRVASMGTAAIDARLQW